MGWRRWCRPFLVYGDVPIRVASGMDSRSRSDEELPVAKCTDADGVITLRHSDGSLVRLRAGVDVFEGDEITTTAMAHATIQFIDDGVLAIDPTTALKIDRFHWYRTPKDLCHITIFHGTVAFLGAKIARIPDAVIMQVGPMVLNVQRAGLLCRLSPNGKRSDLVMLPGNPDESGEILVHNNVAVEVLDQPFQTLRIDDRYGYVTRPMAITSQVLLGMFRKGAVGPLLNQIVPLPTSDDDNGPASVFETDMGGFQLFGDLEDRLLERRFLTQHIFPNEHGQDAREENELLEDVFDGERFRLKASGLQE